MPTILQTVTMNLLDANTCKATFNRINPVSGNSVQASNVCTSPGNVGLSACSVSNVLFLTMCGIQMAVSGVENSWDIYWRIFKYMYGGC